jgi:hypothetical protein
VIPPFNKGIEVLLSKAAVVHLGFWGCGRPQYRNLGGAGTEFHRAANSSMKIEMAEAYVVDVVRCQQWLSLSILRKQRLAAASASFTARLRVANPKMT